LLRHFIIRAHSGIKLRSWRFKNQQTNDRDCKGAVLKMILNVVRDEFRLPAFWDR